MPPASPSPKATPPMSSTTPAATGASSPCTALPSVCTPTGWGGEWVSWFRVQGFASGQGQELVVAAAGREGGACRRAGSRATLGRWACPPACCGRLLGHVPPLWGPGKPSIPSPMTYPPPPAPHMPPSHASRQVYLERANASSGEVARVASQSPQLPQVNQSHQRRG